MVVGQGSRRRVIVAVDMLYRPVGIEQKYGFIAGREEIFKLVPYKMPVRLARGICERLVHIRYQHRAGIGADKPLHILAHTERRGKFCPAHICKERQIRLYEQTYRITQLIYLLLHGTLGEAQEIHIACLCHEHIIEQHIEISAHHVLLFIAHRVGTAQTHSLAVQEKHAFFAAVLACFKASHAECALGAVGFSAVDGESGKRLVEIGRVLLPEADIVHFHAQTDEARAAVEGENLFFLHALGIFEVAGADDVSVIITREGYRSIFKIFEHLFLKILAVYGEGKAHILGRDIITVVYFTPYLVFAAFRHRAHEKVGDEHPVAYLGIYALIYSHPGRTVVPAERRIVISGTCGGIHFVAPEPHVIVVGGVVSVIDVVVFDNYKKRISAFSAKPAYIKFKRSEKSLVRAGEIAVYIDLAGVIHAVKMQKSGFPAGDFAHFKLRAVVCRLVSDGTLIVRYGYAFPFALAGEYG